MIVNVIVVVVVTVTVTVMLVKLLEVLGTIGLCHASQESSAVCLDFPQTGVMLWK